MLGTMSEIAYYRRRVTGDAVCITYAVRAAGTDTWRGYRIDRDADGDTERVTAPMPSAELAVTTAALSVGWPGQ